jgi:hypothetical protein
VLKVENAAMADVAAIEVDSFLYCTMVLLEVTCIDSFSVLEATKAEEAIEIFLDVFDAIDLALVSI